MAISVDEVTKVITVPQADLQFVSANTYSLDTNQFHLDLREWEKGEQGSWRSKTHDHNAPVTVGGVTLARVIEIINNYTVTFEDGQYRVLLLGSNNNILDVANLNQVSIAPNNSAGLTYSKEIEDQSYLEARVYIDTVSGQAGVLFPRGTPGDPVDTLADAQSVITNRGLPNRLFLVGSESLSGTEQDADWLGGSSQHATLTFVGSVDVDGSVFDRISISGSMAGVAAFSRCLFGSLSGFLGSAYDCGLGGTLTLPPGALSDAILLEGCFSTVPGTGTPIIDCNDATGVQLSVRGYDGGVEIRKMSDASNVVTIDLDSGHVVLASSCTDGTIVVRGTGHLTDNSVGATVVKTGLVHTEPIKDLMEADEEYSATTAKKFHRTTKALLLDKNVSGGTPPASTITIDE